MADDDFSEVPNLPSQEDEPPTMVTTETHTQTFTRILGHLDIKDDFINSVLVPLRIRTFRKAMILDEEQLKEVTVLSDSSNDPGMRTDSLQFFSLLKTDDYYLKHHKEKHVPWATLDEESLFDLITDFKLMTKERVEELDKTRIEVANQSNNAN